MASAGRPQKPIDWELLDNLLEAGCSAAEIAPHFHMTDETLCKRVHEHYGMSWTLYSAEKCSKGDSILRAAQYHKAIGNTDKGDNTMMVWLGKNRLKQRDTPVDNTVTQVQVDISKAIMDQLTKAQQEKNSLDNKSEST
jgi:hypothetical protein